MSDKDEKNIHVREGQKERDPYGSPGRVPSSRDGWTIGLGGSGGGRGEGGRPGTLSGSKRRRLRLQDKHRREQEARQKAEADRQAQIDAAAKAEQAAQAQREAAAREASEVQARAHTEAAAQAQAARALAHRQAVDSLAQALPRIKADLDQKHTSARASLASRVQSEVQTGVPTSSNSGQLLLNEILEQKTRVHYLIAQTAVQRDEKNRRAYALTGANPKTIDDAQHRAILLARSSTAEQAHQVHHAWLAAYTDAQEAEILAEFESLLNEQSEHLSKRYAEQSWELQNLSGDVPELSTKQLTDLSRFWQVVAGPSTSSQPTPAAADIAKAVAEKLFTRQAVKVLGRALPHLALFYPTELANGELLPSILATPASKIGVTGDVDLAFIADRRGTVDVTHRLAPDPQAQDGRLKWVKADGINYGTKVRVRPVTYDLATNTYTFTRDGETAPTLTWTPQVRPGNSSTHLPSATQNSPAYTGAKPDNVLPRAYVSPEHTREPDDYILDLPAELGGSQYVYFKDPRDIPGIASGMGETISGTWLGEKTRNEGASIPSQIADQLRGRTFSSFDRLREAIWEEVAKDPVLNKDFTKQNLSLMKNGDAPFPPEGEQRGGRQKFEIHHVDEVAQGGEVYDFPNMLIMTPNAHINHHRNNKQ